MYQALLTRRYLFSRGFVAAELRVDDVPSTLDSVGGFARTQGIALEPRAAVPSAFPRPSAGALPAPLEESLVAALALAKKYKPGKPLEPDY